jgi:hypothetical protein
MLKGMMPYLLFRLKLQIFAQLARVGVPNLSACVSGDSQITKNSDTTTNQDIIARKLRAKRYLNEPICASRDQKLAVR